MSSTRPYLGTHTERFSEAFPEIEDLQVNIVQDKFGYYFEKDWAQSGIYNLNNVRPQIACGNPRCRRGGFDLERFLRMMVLSGKTEEAHSERCPGDEGSPKGRRPGPNCMNQFEVTAKITYRHKTN